LSSTRPWEKWWNEKAPNDFPRSSKRVDGRKIDVPTTESPVRKVIVEEALKSGNTVLDGGCATCIDYELFRDTKIKYTGIDITEKFLDYAKRLYPEIDVRHVSITNLPFPDSSYDTVYYKSIVEHLHPDEWRTALTEGWRVAKHKFMLCFVLKPWDKPTEYKQTKNLFWNNRLNRQELYDYLKSIGVKKIRYDENIGRHDLYVMEKQE